MVTQISTLNELLAIGNDLTGSYELTANIDCSSAPYGTFPIGGSYSMFTGTLDGKGYTLSNLSGYGLFHTLDGTVKNLRLQNRVMKPDSGIAGLCGGIARESASNCLIQVCVIDGLALSFSGMQANAGIFVCGFTGTITDCYLGGTLSNSSSLSVDIIGENWGSATISDCFFDYYAASSMYAFNITTTYATGITDVTNQASFEPGLDFVNDFEMTGTGPAIRQGAATAPNAPTNFVTTWISANAIELSWEASAGATSYVIDCYDVTDSTPVSFDPFTSNYAMLENGIWPNHEYAISVQAVNAIGSSDPTSLPANIATPTVLTVPPAPTVQIGAPQTSNSITLAYTAYPSAMNVTAYETQYKASVDPTYTNAGQQLIFTGLAPATSYDFQIRVSNASSGGGWSEWSTVFVTSTLPAAFAATLSPSSTSINVTWPNVSSGYNIYWETGIKPEYQFRFSNMTYVPAAGGDTTSFNITGLSASTGYSVWVEDAKDCTPYSYKTTTTTAGAPTLSVYLNYEYYPSQIFVSWDDLLSTTGYTLYWSAGDVIQEGADSLVTTDTYYRVEGLTPNTLYTFRVVNNDDTEIAGIAQITTSPVLVVTGQAESATSVRLNWTSTMGLYDIYWDISSVHGVINEGDISYTNAEYGVDGTTFVIQGLTEGTEYLFLVNDGNYQAAYALATPQSGGASPDGGGNPKLIIVGTKLVKSLATNKLVQDKPNQ